MVIRPRSIIAHHIILTLYGHWPPNDPRGSVSTAFLDDKFAPLGPIHYGRKPPEEQPSSDELREFQRHASELMNFPVFWLDDEKRQAIADAYHEVILSHHYTCYACAILWNQCMRIHRDRDGVIIANLQNASAARLRRCLIPGAELTRPDAHPIWNGRPYSKFLFTPDDVLRTIGYVEGNPEKEKLPPQHWPFVQPYDNWPHHK